MSAELKFKAYRDLPALERDVPRMEAEGWRLRGSRVRSEAVRPEPGPMPDYYAYDPLLPYQPQTVAASGCLWAPMLLMQLLSWLVSLPWVLFRGRKRIDAAWEREDVGGPIVRSRR